MYNLQVYIRDKQLRKQCERVRREHYSQYARREKWNPSFIHSHKKRIEGFILSMIERPTYVTPYKNSPYQPRPIDKSKNLSADTFYFSHRTDSGRLQEAADRSKFLDGVPFMNPSSHQYRYFKDRGLRYQPVTGLLKVKYQLDKQSLNYLPNNTNPKLDRLLHDYTMLGSSIPSTYLKKLLHKSLLPILHQKTYFNSVNTIFSYSPNCLTNHYYNYEKDQQPILEDYEDDNELGNNKKDPAKNNEHINYKENSRYALIKCGLLKVLDNHKRLRSTGTCKYHSYLQTHQAIKDIKDGQKTTCVTSKCIVKDNIKENNKCINKGNIQLPSNKAFFQKSSTTCLR